MSRFSMIAVTLLMSMMIAPSIAVAEEASPESVVKSADVVEATQIVSDDNVEQVDGDASQGADGNEQVSDSSGQVTNQDSEELGSGTKDSSLEESNADGSLDKVAVDDADQPGEEKPDAVEKVEDGTYIIESALGFDLDIAAGSTSNGANAQIYGNNYTPAQRFQITATSQVGDNEWYYTITSINSGKVLDCAGGGISNGTNVQQYQSNGTAAQQWYLRKQTSSAGLVTYLIVNVGSGLSLDVSGGWRSNGANIQLYSLNGTAAQSWFLKKCVAVLENGAYVIGSSLAPNRVLDIASGSGDAGARVQLYQDNKTLAQAFSLAYDNYSGYYTVTNYGSGLVLDVPAASSANGVQLQQYSSNGTNAQKWHIVKNADGSFTFFAALNGKALDVAAGQAKNGASVQQYAYNGTMAQRFVLTGVTPSASQGIVYIRDGQSTGLVVDVPAGSTAANTVLQLYGLNGTFAQKYQLTKGDDGLYTLASVVSGLYLGWNEKNQVVQVLEDSECVGKWEVFSNEFGHFVLRLAATGQLVGASQGNVQGSLLQLGATGLGWNFVSAPLIKTGLYVMAAMDNGNCVLDVASGSLNWGANIQYWTSNETNAQKFYVQHLGGDVYAITNAWTALVLDVSCANKVPGANVQQYGWNGTNAQKWVATWAPGKGTTFTSALGGLVLGAWGGSVTQGANACLVSATEEMRGFALLSTKMATPSQDDLIRVLNTVAGSGLNVTKSAKGLSGAAFSAIQDAIWQYESRGYSVTFTMMDLKTGAGVTYNADNMMYSASMLKGPYVSAFAQYCSDQIGSWTEDRMWWSIYNSDNWSYETLRDTYGTWPLAQLAAATNAGGFDWYEYYTYVSARDLAKMWVGMYEFFNTNGYWADWCRNVFSSNEYITSRDALSWENATIYAKSGWIEEWWNFAGIVHNEGCVVMAGDNPYLMTIMTNNQMSNSWLMSNLMNALGHAHAEMVV